MLTIQQVVEKALSDRPRAMGYLQVYGGSLDHELPHGARVQLHTFRDGYGVPVLSIKVLPKVPWTDGTCRPVTGGGWKAEQDNFCAHLPMNGVYVPLVQEYDHDPDPIMQEA